MNEKEGIVAKVRKCLALGDKSSGTTEAEMATALGMARRLMDQYHLTEAEVLAASVSKEALSVVNRVAPTRKNPHRYEINLAIVVRLLFGVEPLLSGEYSDGAYRRVIKLYGTEVDVACAASAFELLRDTINSMALACGYDGAERDQWRLGVTVTLCQRAKAMKEESERVEAEMCRALVVRKDEAIRAAMGKTKEGRATRYRLTPATVHGKSQGHGIDLSFKERLS